MTEKPRSSPRSSNEPPAERVVIRDNRKIDPNAGKGRHHAKESDDVPAAVEESDTPTAKASAEKSTAAATGGAERTEAEEQPAGAGRATGTAKVTSTGTAKAGGAGPATGAATVPSGASTAEGAVEPDVSAGSAALGAELAALRTEVEERTRDLQRVTAEYANYRKRVDRDRGVAAEQTTGAVLTALLPILDDLDRAREHGDLVGPFASVAEQLNAALAKFGLTGFGEKGDPFDPTRHEAVAHRTSTEVSEPTCVEVMRRGYLLGERLLRAAMVAVADPE